MQKALVAVILSAFGFSSAQATSSIEQRLVVLEFAVQSLLVQMQQMHHPKRFHCFLETGSMVYDGSGETKVEAKAKTLKSCKEDYANKNKGDILAQALYPASEACKLSALVCDE